MTRSLGVDVGGTFTDVVLWDGTDLKTAKVPSTPADQSVGVIAAARSVTDGAEHFFHGTTVATNALLERTGARTALLTSPGYEDVLEIARQDRPSLYDPAARRPEPLVSRELRLSEVPEDLAGVESVAISLQYSFRHPEAEQALRVAIRESHPDLPVSISSELVPEFREYERAATTVLNAYVQPVMARYLSRLADAGANAGLADVLVMRSSGGLISAAGAETHPASALLSGPAGGVMAATELGRALGRDHMISFDMGGTSTDVCRIEGGRPEISSERPIAGYPCRLPSVAVHTVGAGGGSLGWVDAGGALRVGPQSAGARPGPASYGHGGTDAAVTDANLALGRIRSGARFGSDLELHPEAATGVLEQLGEGLDLGARHVAAGMVEVVEEVMAGALRRVSIEQGADPRQSTLVAFGGAGGLHGSALARRLDMAGMIIPLHAGVFSALGLLLSPPRQDWARTVLSSEPEAVDAALGALRRQAREGLRSDGIEPTRTRSSVDVRYFGQSHEVSVPYESGEGWETLSSRFHEAHERRNGFARPDDPIEAVTARIAALGRPALRWEELPPVRPVGEANRGTRPIVIGDETVEASVWWRPGLVPGTEVAGPAVIEEPEATTFLGTGDRALVHDGGALVVEW